MKKQDNLLLFLIILITIFGLFIIYDASSVIAFRDFGDKYHYVKDQFRSIIVSFIALAFFSRFDYKKLAFMALPLLVTTIVLLVLVFIPGIGVYALGAHRWINLHFMILQPTEFAKLSLAIYLAAWFSTKEKGRFMAFCLLIGMVLGLIMLQPDMGTASIILMEGMIVYFLSGGSIKQFILATPIVALVGYILIKLEPYRAARLTTLLNVSGSLNNPANYHVKQILIALGSGGIFGVGLGNSLQKFSYLPENVTDSIFAIIAEEFGFIGSLLLITLYMFVIWRGFLIATHAKDTFGKLLAGAIISFLGIQIVVNLAAMSVLIPLTGVPLPFISFGGSSLIINLAAIGILLNISTTIERKEKSRR